MFLLEVSQNSIAGLEVPLATEYHDDIHNVAAWSSFHNLTVSKRPDSLVLKWADSVGSDSMITFSAKDGVIRVNGSSMFGLPLYYTVDARGAFYCSTHISLMRKVGVDIAENKEVLPEFFVYRNVMPPHTLYKGIKRVLHGGSIKTIFKGGRWSDPEISLPSWLTEGNICTDMSFDDHVGRLASDLTANIKRLKCRQDEMALLMSGGLDSSIISRICQDEYDANETFSTGYPFETESLDMERPYAASAASAMDFHHNHYMSTDSGYRAGLLSSIAALEEPVHHLQMPCLNALFEDGIPTDRAVTVQGLGAGGAFGNFRNHLFMLDKPASKCLGGPGVLSFLKMISAVTGRGRTLISKVKDLRNKYPYDDCRNPIWQWHQYGDMSWVCEHFSTSPDDVISRQRKTMESVNANSIYHLWAVYSLLGDEDITLTLSSKLAYSNSKYMSSPFYDMNVLKHAFSMPWQMKLRSPENSVRKSMALALGVPAFVVKRRKTGFGVKRDDWAVAPSLFDPLTRLAEKVVDHDMLSLLRTRNASEAMLFWNMINYALWKRLCIEGESLDSLQDELREAEEVTKSNA